jgi:lipopolysaccharide transport system permease protein
VPLRLGEVWEYRELLYFLAWRDIKVRYKQTLLGVAWAVIQPLLTMVVFSIFFGRLARMPSDGLPYPLFAYCALLPWQLFAFTLSESSTSVVSNQRLVTKVYFPRLIIPLAAIGSGLMDFAISFCFLLVLIGVFGVVPGMSLLALPAFVLLAVVTALGFGLWLSALNVRYRDVRYTIPFLIQIWLFATPVAYPVSIVPEAWRPFYGLNPMVGVVEGFRWALLGGRSSPDVTVAVSATVAVAVLTSGLFYFRSTEATFADLV